MILMSMGSDNALAASRTRNTAAGNSPVTARVSRA